MTLSEMKATQPKENEMNPIRNFDPKAGQAYQGDVAIVAVPPHIAIADHDEIAPKDGRLILQEGEVTGHHHAIYLDGPRARHFRTEGADISYADALAGAEPTLRGKLTPKMKADRRVGTARMFRDPAAANAMVSAGILDRADLCVGFLKVEGGSVVVKHEEHGGIRLPEGTYYCGRQIESAGAEERVVAD